MKALILFILFIIPCWIFAHTSIVSASDWEHVLTLEEAVQIGISRNHIITRASERTEESVQQKRSAKAAFLPKVSADYSFTHLADYPYLVTDGGRKAQVASTSQYRWGVTLIQPLFTGHALTSSYDITKLNVEIRQKEKQQTILDVTKGVKSACYQLLLARKMLAVAGETVVSLDSHQHDAQRFHDRGIIRLNDLLRAKVALAEAKQFQVKTKALYQIAQSDLNRWLAIDINLETQIEDITTAPMVETDLELLLDQGRENRPLLQVMRLAADIFKKTIALEESSYFPQVVLAGGYERNGDNLLAENNDFENEHNAFISIKANWLLFDWSQREANVSSAKAKLRAHQALIRELEDNVMLEIKDAFLKLQVACKNIETSKESVKLANENLRITNLGYRQQVTTSTEVLDVRADLTRSLSLYYQALYGYLDAVAGLERAIGMELIKQGST